VTVPDERAADGGLTKLAIRRADAALRNGDPEAALKWLQSVAAPDRPKGLEAEIRYATAKLAATRGEWGRCERELEVVLRLDPNPFYQRRLERVRRRGALLDDAMWQMLRERVDPARRLPADHLAPTISSVWACGAYHSRGHGRGLPWSRLLREAKNPPRDEEERGIILKAACGFLCRYIVADTPLLRHADAVVAIPPDPERYARRGMSLPDNLAMAVEHALALLWPMEALVRTKSVELRELSRSERHQAIKGSMAARDVTLVKGRCALLVDDVTTSGATLSEAATVLRSAGAHDVHAVTLCHTEG
jgi:hypothetical protein